MPYAGAGTIASVAGADENDRRPTVRNAVPASTHRIPAIQNAGS